MSGVGEGDVAARLSAELARLAGLDAFQILGLNPDATGEAVRAAFLGLTKQFHPNRFAREMSTSRDLANEVFLVIRKAYEQLGDEAKRKAWRDRRAARSDGAIPTRRTTPPAGFAPIAGPKPPTAPPSQATPPRAMPGVQPTPRAPTPVPGATTPPRPTPAVSRSATPTQPQQAILPAHAPIRAVGKRTQPPSPTMPPGEVQQLLELARTRGARFEEALKEMAQGRFRLARETLHKICAEDPQNKRYRTQLHLAWGFECIADKRPEDGARELERAMSLDPECEEAQTALRKLNEGKKSGGFLSKLFGR